MFHKVIKVETLSDKILKVKFDNNEIKYYDVKKIINKIKEFELLKNEIIFKNVKIDAGGYAVMWSEELDIDCEELYQNGFYI